MEVEDPSDAKEVGLEKSVEEDICPRCSEVKLVKSWSQSTDGTMRWTEEAPVIMDCGAPKGEAFIYAYIKARLIE